MMKTDIYKINNSIDKLINGKYTLFLDQREFNLLKSKLKKKDYNIYLPYKDSEKVILYSTNTPEVSLYKINSYSKLTHPMILGSILGLNIQNSYLGDIIVDNDNYYFYILSTLDNYIKDNLLYVGNNKVTIEKIDLDTLNNYEREYESHEIIVSSLRIDNVISKIIKTNRDRVIDKIKNKEVILNYELLSKNSYILKENDIFSIRKYGKYKYIGVINNTKRDNYVIKYLKYI